MRPYAGLSDWHGGLLRCHHLGTALAQQGYQDGVIPVQFVRPFVKSNNNDYVDAKAIAEVMQRPTMRFIPIRPWTNSIYSTAPLARSVPYRTGAACPVSEIHSSMSLRICSIGLLPNRQV